MGLHHKTYQKNADNTQKLGEKFTKMKKLTILWTVIGAAYYLIYVTSIMNYRDPGIAGLATLLSFMTASIIESLPKNKKEEMKNVNER